jgi:predicted transcriptional regulator
MKDKNMTDKRDFIVTTTSGTRWAAIGTSLADVRENFFGSRIGLEIANVEAGSLFTHEESEQLRREKIEEMCR